MSIVIRAPKTHRPSPQPVGGAGAENKGAWSPYWEISIRRAMTSGVHYLVANLHSISRSKEIIIPELELRILSRMITKGANLTEILNASLPYWQALPKYARRELVRTVIPIIALFLGR